MNRTVIFLLTFLVLATFTRADVPTALNFPRPDRAEIVSVEPGATDGPKAELSAANFPGGFIGPFARRFYH